MSYIGITELLIDLLCSFVVILFSIVLGWLVIKIIKMSSESAGYKFIFIKFEKMPYKERIKYNEKKIKGIQFENEIIEKAKEKRL